MTTPGNRRPRKVLYVHHAGTLGGASNSLRLLLGSLPRDQVTPIVLSPPGSAAEAFSAMGIEVEPVAGLAKYTAAAQVPFHPKELLLAGRELWHLRSARILRDAIRRHQPDLVHLNEWTLLHAAAVARSEGIPTVLHARVVANRDRRLATAVGRGLIGRLADHVIAIDQSVATSLAPLPAVSVVYNPLWPRAEAPDRAPERLAAGRVRVTFLAILLEQKGVWDLLDAAELLKSRDDIVFEVAGGNSRPPEFHASLFGRACHAVGVAPDIEAGMRRQVARRGLENVEMLGSVSKVRDLLQASDILVFPSHMNGPGRSVFEAGVYGVPAIVALKDRVEDIVEDGVTGRIVPERNPGALAKAILELADDPGLRRRLGDAARRKYAESILHREGGRRCPRGLPAGADPVPERPAGRRSNRA